MKTETPDEMGMPLSDIQTRLWKLVDVELAKIGGFAGISRNPDENTRRRGQTPGTREHALLKCAGLASGIISDTEAAELYAIITK